MQLSDFDFDLPPDLIAKYPAASRTASRLMVVGQETVDREFADIEQLLRPHDVLVLNDTRVIPARLRGRKSTGGKVEVLVERLLSEREALAHVRASKTPRPGSSLEFAEGVEAEVTGRTDDLFRLRFSRAIGPVLDEHGSVPLPPYIDRAAERGDSERYQTVYAKADGAVAAPTAGLHFDTPMLERLAACGVRQAFVTLHVGAGTFQSLRENEVEKNVLQKERVQVGVEALEIVQTAREQGGRVIAVGTTSVRALETAFAADPPGDFSGETDLFIYPCYRFRVVDAMLTNFHLPQSSLLMLVAAFAGRKRILDAYRHAVSKGYRFFSYGDAMLLFPENS